MHLRMRQTLFQSPVRLSGLSRMGEREGQGTAFEFLALRSAV
jgi:hypothetical protein